MMNSHAAPEPTTDAADPAAGAGRYAGFGLVELIVALLILSVGLVALTGAAAVAQRSLAGARASEEAADLVELMLDSLMGEAAPVSGARREGPATVQWTVREDSAAVRIDLDVMVLDGPRQRRLAFTSTHHAR